MELCRYDTYHLIVYTEYLIVLPTTYHSTPLEGVGDDYRLNSLNLITYLPASSFYVEFIEMDNVH